MSVGAAWGYFILVAFLVNMLADILTLLVAATFATLLTQTTSEDPSEPPELTDSQLCP